MMACQTSTTERLEPIPRQTDGEYEYDALNREIEEILGRITHAFRSPLWALTGFAGELQNRKARSLDPETQTYIGHVCNCGRRMNDLVQSLVDLRNEARPLADPKPVDLSALVEDALLDLVQRDPQRQLRVTIEPRRIVTGDPERLKTVVRHLLENAWKFTAVRPVTRIAFGECAAATGGDAPPMRTFRLRDNGVGYAPDMANRLFSPFERLHAASEYEGAGMGLATARRIIRLHRGRIWSESDGVNGATFFFSLPR